MQKSPFSSHSNNGPMLLLADRGLSWLKAEKMIFYNFNTILFGSYMQNKNQPKRSRKFDCSTCRVYQIRIDLSNLFFLFVLNANIKFNIRF
jgi:hypothetical protein